MKNLPFLIVIFVALLITYLSPALSSAQTITVSAYVPEHLSYFKDGEKITFSTNYESGVLIIFPEKTVLFPQPCVQTFNQSTTFLAVVPF